MVITTTTTITTTSIKVIQTTIIMAMEVPTRIQHPDQPMVPQTSTELFIIKQIHPLNIFIIFFSWKFLINSTKNNIYI